MITIPLFKVHMNKNAPKMVGDVLLSGMITQSKQVEKFEEELKKYFNYPYILTLNSATSGLTLAYRLLDIQQSDEIIATPLTCFATTAAILAHNATIIWADTDPNTCNIDLEDVKSKITKNTKAISFVHWAGMPVNLNKVAQIKKYSYEKFGINLGVVEDCAHSFGTEWAGKKLGTHGNIAVYSLQAIKHLTTGDGGLIFLPNKEMYERAKLLRWYGISREIRSKPGTDYRLEPDIVEYGYKFHMNDINATIGLANLPDMPKLLEKTKENANYYDLELSKLEGIKVLERHKLANPSYWIYTLNIKYGMKEDLLNFMKEKNIVVSQVHARNDTNSCVLRFKNNLPKLNQIMKEFISIPVGWWITDENRKYIVECFKEFLSIYSPKIETLQKVDIPEYINLLTHMNDYKENTIHLEPETCNSIYVVKVNNEIVSSVKLLIENKVYQSMAHIEDVVTKKEKRGRGYSQLILKYVTNKAQKLNCYKTVFGCKPSLIPFYESCGFKQDGVMFTMRH